MDFEAIKKDFNQHKATYILTIVTLAIWLGQYVTFGNQATAWQNIVQVGGLYKLQMLVDPSQMWRLFTAIFIHIGWGHIMMNMLTLFFIGRQVEEIFGWRSFAVIYLLSGIFGNALSFFITPAGGVSAGASGAIFGIFGAVAGLGYFTGMPAFKQIGKTFLVLIVINLVYDMFDLGTINIWAHIGGAVGGLLLSAIFPPKALKRAIPPHYRLISSIVMLVLFVAFLVIPFVY
ncbi:rhomboid family intramembrane serine protease [Lactococcus nasutitermitis]|uniref:Rhomboid family intramembrane serine protease n=1 Tax=Lactococcus nasutitermitis TaxID=1652957 RepID=A0ABV9JEY6_9LACT|nr:rhomboid family intramembrane serine protease [Lactococcus nasutitermitis]